MYDTNIKNILTACCYTCHPSPSNHSFCLRTCGGFHLSLSANCIWCIATWPSIQNTVKTLQRTLHSSRKMDKKAQKKEIGTLKKQKSPPNPGQIRDADSHGTNIITGPPFSAKYGRSFAGELLLYKLQTWPIRTGLRSQTTSAIITNDWRSPGNTYPVRIGL